MRDLETEDGPIPTHTVVPDYPLSAIEPNAANPRVITAANEAALRDSLGRFGMVGVLVVNERTDGRRVLISGHQRLKQMQAAGMTHGPVILTSLSIHDETSLGLMLNGHQGRFRDEMLKSQLEALEQAGRDLKGLGLAQDKSFRTIMEGLGKLIEDAPKDDKKDEGDDKEQTGPVKVTVGQYRFEISPAEYRQVCDAAEMAGMDPAEYAANRLGVG